MKNQWEVVLDRYTDWIEQTIPALTWQEIEKEVELDRAFGAAVANFLWWLLRKGKKTGGWKDRSG